MAGNRFGGAAVRASAPNSVHTNTKKNSVKWGDPDLDLVHDLSTPLSSDSMATPFSSMGIRGLDGPIGRRPLEASHLASYRVFTEFYRDGIRFRSMF